jgi:methionyl-tRNA synthetase
VNFGNKKMEDEKPWASIKGEEGSTERKKGEGTLCGLLEVLRHVSIMLEPFLPITSANIRNQLGLEAMGEFDKEKEWGSKKGWNKLGESKIMFPRVEASPSAK